MAFTGVDEFDLSAAQLYGHLVAECFGRRSGGNVAGGDIAGSVFVSNDFHPRLSPDFAAGDMVGVKMAVNNHFDRLAETLLNLVLQPFGGLGVDRVGDDHPFRRD